MLAIQQASRQNHRNSSQLLTPADLLLVLRIVNVNVRRLADAVARVVRQEGGQQFDRQ